MQRTPYSKPIKHLKDSILPVDVTLMILRQSLNIFLQGFGFSKSHYFAPLVKNLQAVCRRVFRLILHAPSQLCLSSDALLSPQFCGKRGIFLRFVITLFLYCKGRFRSTVFSWTLRIVSTYSLFGSHSLALTTGNRGLLSIYVTVWRLHDATRQSLITLWLYVY